MDIFILSSEFAAWLVLKMGSVMFVSLFGIEILMQLGLMKYLRPIGKPVAKLANLPSESALSFLAGIGSMIAAHTMAARFYQDGKLNDRELLVTGVLNTVPFHFKETLTFQLPIVLPLLGAELCLIYIAAFWLAGIIKLCFVVVYGRIKIQRRHGLGDAFELMECDPEDPDCVQRSFTQLLADAWNTRKKMFFRMITLLGAVTMIVQLLMHSGMMQAFEKLIAPMTSLFNLPPAVLGPVSTYILSPTVGITYMSNLLGDHTVTQFQAIVALLAGGVLMIPVTRLRRTLPRYMAIFGFKNGSIICGLTTALSMSSRIVILIWVLIFYHH
jgi:hypothetical protein